jgi:bifunctional ADP-heptose synthase (sugar kinase/adenylyltransferase)
MRDLKVLLVGDAIMDEYVYVKPIGKSIKESVMSTMHEREESFRGGVWAAAEHAKEFAGAVDVQTGAWLMRNKRFLSSDLRKLFTLHKREILHENVGDRDYSAYDMVIVADFGHETLTKPLIDRLTREARYLAVNAQTNSTNFGFNLVTKYPRADLVVIDEIEARLAAHDAHSPIEDVILAIENSSGFHKMIVTMGSAGAVGYDGAFERIPAYAETVRDTMGAGDAFLVLASLASAAGASMRDAVRIGNAAGAVKCSIIGHQQPVTAKALQSLLQPQMGNR